MPSAVVLSILIHAGLFLLAGLLVVFTVLPKEAVEFAPPPPVKVPKIPLKKLKVRTKKPSKPKATAKLTAVVKKIDLQTIAFPDLPSSGLGAGIGGSGGAGGFGDLPGIYDDDGFFGGAVSIGNDLEVTYYDLKRDRKGRYSSLELEDWRAIYRKFFKQRWDTSILSDYYRSPQKRYATCVCIPATATYMAPASFGEGDAPGNFWIALCKGKLVHKEDITFRFWVQAEDSLAIRVNKKVVIAASFVGIDEPTVPSQRSIDSYGAAWESDSIDSLKHIISNGRATVGDWITLRAGEPKDMEIVLTDNQGFGFTAIVAVEVKGVEYERSVRGGPRLPVFRTSDIPRDHLDLIYADLAEGELSLTNGPIFRDY